MTNNFDLVQEVATTVQEILELPGARAYPEYDAFYLRGLTRHNLGLGIKRFVKDNEWRLKIDANGAKKDTYVEEVFYDLVEHTEFVRNSSSRVQYEFRSHDINDIIEAAQSLKEFVDSRDLGSSAAPEVKVGALFVGTQFDRLKERGATISGMFGNLVCQASGMNLLMMQAEYYIEAGEIDGVEFSEDGSVISIYECQSGIHKGVELDDEHTMKALGTYLYDPEIIPTVRKVVILAGAYSEADMQLLRERAYELSRRERPIELVVLITTRVENRIGVERVVLG